MKMDTTDGLRHIVHREVGKGCADELIWEGSLNEPVCMYIYGYVTPAPLRAWMFHTLHYTTARVVVSYLHWEDQRE